MAKDSESTIVDALATCSVRVKVTVAFDAFSPLYPHSEEQRQLGKASSTVTGTCILCSGVYLLSSHLRVTQLSSFLSFLK